VTSDEDERPNTKSNDTISEVHELWIAIFTESRGHAIRIKLLDEIGQIDL
jgi:hypothetical protein